MEPGSFAERPPAVVQDVASNIILPYQPSLRELRVRQI